MSRTGRPRLPKRQRRSKYLPVRFSELELEILRSHAKKRGWTLTSFIRHKLFRGTDGRLLKRRLKSDGQEEAAPEAQASAYWK